MDQLELLKKSWDKTSNSDKHFSVKELYPMLLKKSSSTVKTLFYISIGELVFWVIINLIPFLLSEERKAKLNELYGHHAFLDVLNVFQIAIIIAFVYLLFKSYKAISVTDNAKKLMESILHTRKVIKYYVMYNLCWAFFSLILGFYLVYQENPEFHSRIDTANSSEMFSIILKLSIFIAFILGVFWLLYKLIYGLLIRRLTANYKELKKIEG